MARCGCNNTCSCLLADGACTTVTGLGSAIAPYRVEVTVDGDTIVCGPNGLQSSINTLDTDSVDLSGDGSAATPLSAVVFMQDDNTGPLAGTPGGGANLLKLNPGQGINGLYVSCEDIQDCVGASIGPNLAGSCLEYNDIANQIDVQLDTDPSNIIGCGTGPTGQGLYAAGAGVVQGDCILITGTGTPGDPFVVNTELAAEPNGVDCTAGGLLVTPSTDVGNQLVFGTDNNLFVPCGDVDIVGVTLVGVDGTNCLTVVETSPEPGCPSTFEVRLGISDDPNQVLECHTDGLFVCDGRTDAGLSGPFNTNAGPFNSVGPLPQTIIGPTACATITNNSTCRDMNFNAEFLYTVDMRADAGTNVFTMLMEISFDGGATFVGGPQTGIIDNTSRQGGRFGSQTADEVGPLAPGASRTICIRPNVTGNNVVNGIILNMNYDIQLYGQTI